MFDDYENIYKSNNKYIKLETFLRNESIMGILIDVTGDVVERQRIEQERDEDILTELLSRRGFYSQMDILFEKPEKLRNSALIMIDTDGLKYVNDNFGHEAGDCYLCAMAGVLRSNKAPNKLMVRLSGDEFALFIYDCDMEELNGYIQQLRDAQQNQQCIQIDQSQVFVSFSIGYSLFPDDGFDYHTLLKIADVRMYEEKRIRKKANDK